MRKVLFTLFGSALAAACSKAPPPAEPAGHFSIDPARITVSGISSGAYMAGQLHVAHSATFSGAGLLAGGPYGCAEGSITQAIGPCVKGENLDVAHLAARAREAAAAGSIDAVENLADDNVWLFIGTLDDKVAADAVRAAGEFYGEFSGKALLVDDVVVVHGMPTLENGLACDAFGTPFIQDCGYDAAGILLGTLLGELQPRAAAGGELRTIPQPGGTDAEMLDEALLYVPASCADGESCGVHVAFHGCLQSTEFVGDAFARGAGYNEWAESNNLLVLYPQVASSKVAPMNPYGCWDWWGYTGEAYATKDGAQLKVVKATLDALAEMRRSEGERIEEMILSRCDEVLRIAGTVRVRMPEVLEATRLRQRERIEKLDIEADPARLETELALVAQKLDVDEELDRLESHVKEIRDAVASDEPVGRRLDFLMQELNREANTLGSKSADAGTTKAAVDLKVLIEQMREQIQNVE